MKKHLNLNKCFNQMRIPGEVSKKHYNMDNYPPEGTEEHEMEKLV